PFAVRVLPFPETAKSVDGEWRPEANPYHIGCNFAFFGYIIYTKQFGNYRWKQKEDSSRNREVSHYGQSLCSIQEN
ncbi:MAG: hypothetical protein IJJ33_03320, partial [Victivallales bacterium]|nr:hypothetical protein [Victivallales bacterium]